MHSAACYDDVPIDSEILTATITKPVNVAASDQIKRPDIFIYTIRLALLFLFLMTQDVKLLNVDGKHGSEGTLE